MYGDMLFGAQKTCTKIEVPKTCIAQQQQKECNGCRCLYL